MNKAELIGWLQTHYKEDFGSKAVAERAIAAVVDGIKSGLGAGGTKVQLVGFGTFEVRERQARKGRNPRTGASLDIPASRSVSFRPGKTLKAALAPKKDGGKAKKGGKK